MNKKAIVPLILLIATGVFFSCKLIADKRVFAYSDGIEIEPFQAPENQTLTKNQAILETISKVISDAHYSPKLLNDDFSKRVFQLYMEQSDYGKLFLHHVIFLPSNSISSLSLKTNASVRATL